MSQWFSVQDALPKDCDEVLIVNIKCGHSVYQAIYFENMFGGHFKLKQPKFYEQPPIEATHWLPIPDTEPLEKSWLNIVHG